MPAPAMKVLFLPKWYPDRNDPQNGIFIRKHALAVSGFCDVKVLRIARDSDMSPKFRIELRAGDFDETFSYYRPHDGKIKRAACQRIHSLVTLSSTILTRDIFTSYRTGRSPVHRDHHPGVD